MNPGFGRNADRISELPDSILTHILSFLPTKHVLGTSILSKRWENVWKGVPSLDFNDTLLLEKSKKLIADRRETLEMSFVHHVNRVLLLTEVQRIKRFSLVLKKLLYTCDYEKARHNNEVLNLWITSAIKLNVQEICLCLLIRLIPASLRRVLFTSGTLLRLDLEMEGVNFLDVPAAVWLPNLKFLRLKSVRYEDEIAALRLFSGCPVLENLFLIRAHKDNCETLRISIPTLKVLSVESEPTDLLYEVREQRGYIIKVDCPNLEKLFLKDLFSEINGENLSKVYEAEIEVGLSFMDSSICNFLNGIANVKVLRLFGAVASIFCKRDTVLPIYRNLISLELSPTSNICINFLECCPNLDVLNLKKGTAVSDSDSIWDPPPQVPKCLISHLREITLHKIRELDGGLVAIEYLMRNAKVLKKLTISGEMLGPNQAAALYTKLESFPKGCKNCQLRILSEGFNSFVVID